MLQKKTAYTVAVVGATGAVGEEMVKTLAKRNFPVNSLRLFASARSQGKEMIFQGKMHAVSELNAASFAGVDIALFSAGSTRSKEFVPLAVKSGVVVIDNSSAFRMDPNVPLVVPEINPQDAHKHQGIIANPNCSTIIMALPLFPIHKVNRIKQIIVATYQAVSGAGAQALAELKQQQRDALSGKTPVPQIFPHVIAGNLFCHDSQIMTNGYNQEEMKMVMETRKLFHDDKLKISPTCVRVPIERAHSEAIYLKLSQKVSVYELLSVLKAAPGLRLVDDWEKNHFPMPLEASGKDEVLVGRLRDDPQDDTAMSLFVCGDQLLKGAALNAVQIAELLIE